MSNQSSGPSTTTTNTVVALNAHPRSAAILSGQPSAMDATANPGRLYYDPQASPTVYYSATATGYTPVGGSGSFSTLGGVATDNASLASALTLPDAWAANPLSAVFSYPVVDVGPTCMLGGIKFDRHDATAPDGQRVFAYLARPGQIMVGSPKPPGADSSTAKQLLHTIEMPGSTLANNGQATLSGTFASPVPMPASGVTLIVEITDTLNRDLPSYQVPISYQHAAVAVASTIPFSFSLKGLMDKNALACDGSASGFFATNGKTEQDINILGPLTFKFYVTYSTALNQGGYVSLTPKDNVAAVAPTITIAARSVGRSALDTFRSMADRPVSQTHWINAPFNDKAVFEAATDAASACMIATSMTRQSGPFVGQVGNFVQAPGPTTAFYRTDASTPTALWHFWSKSGSNINNARGDNIRGFWPIIAKPSGYDTNGYPIWDLQIPTPASIKFAGSDQNYSCVMPDGHTVMEVFFGSRNATTGECTAPKVTFHDLMGGAFAAIYNRIDLSNDGPGSGINNGTRGAGGPLHPGMIQKWELDQGKIDHRLVIVNPEAKQKSTPPVSVIQSAYAHQPAGAGVSFPFVIDTSAVTGAYKVGDVLIPGTGTLTAIGNTVAGSQASWTAGQHATFMVEAITAAGVPTAVRVLTPGSYASTFTSSSCTMVYHPAVTAAGTGGNGAGLKLTFYLLTENQLGAPQGCRQFPATTTDSTGVVTLYTGACDYGSHWGIPQGVSVGAVFYGDVAAGVLTVHQLINGTIMNGQRIGNTSTTVTGTGAVVNGFQTYTLSNSTLSIPYSSTVMMNTDGIGCNTVYGTVIALCFQQYGAHNLDTSDELTQTLFVYDLVSCGSVAAQLTGYGIGGVFDARNATSILPKLRRHVTFGPMMFGGPGVPVTTPLDSGGLTFFQ